MKSNKELMDRLKVDATDVFEDPDDEQVIDKLKAIINEERDALEKYWKDTAKYNRLMKNMEKSNPVFQDD